MTKHGLSVVIVERARATSVLVDRVELAGCPLEVRSWDIAAALKAAGLVAGGNLVKEALHALGGAVEGAVGEVRPVLADADKGVRLASVAAKRDRVLLVLGEDLGGNERDGVRDDTAVPVRRQLLRAEEVANGLVVGVCLVASAGHELVEEGRGTKEEQRLDGEVEVAVLVKRLLVALVAVLCHLIALVDTTGAVVHHLVESPVE